MSDNTYFKNQLFNINEENFSKFALELFYHQSKNNHVYNQYLNYLGIKSPYDIKKISDIPFLPIEFFKTYKILTGKVKPEYVFESSGTTGSDTSKHYIADLSFYKKVSEKIFNDFFGPLEDYIFLCLMPSYLERKNASLIYMLDHFINKSNSYYSGFYLNEWQSLVNTLHEIKKQNKKIQLWGVTFALLSLAEKYPMDLSFLEIIETGGMKGKREEKTREEVHQKLKSSFNLNQIYSEYGMTELLSQAYSRKNGIFQTPVWMQFMLREFSDPFNKGGHLKAGGLNIIDLANIDSCAFIETMDIGRKAPEGNIQIMGRYDHSDARGCNLMII